MNIPNFLSTFSNYLQENSDPTIQVSIPIRDDSYEFGLGDAIAQVLSNRYFFITENGNFSIGSRFLQCSDWICYIQTATTPQVLRPQDSYWICLRNANVSDIMFRETESVMNTLFDIR
jgi:hypothetical protein